MKDITRKINESQQDLCSEVQNEFTKDYAYQSFVIIKNKYEYGFLTYNKDEEFYSVTAFNEDSEFAETFAGEYNLDVDEIINLKVGESLSDTSHGPNYVYTIIRIW